jgi:multidrug efflux pump subunit AcrA (membrane-fusion protein)
MHTTVALTAEQVKTIGIETGAIATRSMATSIKVNGIVRVLNQNKALITAVFGGIVQTINVHQGDVIKKGQTIATLSNPAFITLQEDYLLVQAQLDAGKPDAVATLANVQYAALHEQYSSLQPLMALADKEVKRQRELNSGHAGSAKSLQQAETEYAVLQARNSVLESQLSVFSKHANQTLLTRRAALEAKLKLLGINPLGLNPKTLQPIIAIKSPISGKVGEITAKIGAYMTESTSIAEVIDLDNLHLDLNVYENQLDKFKKGQTLHFTSVNNPSQLYAAEVHTIGVMLDPVSKTVEIHAHIEGNKAGLVEGMTVGAIVENVKSDLLAVPNIAIATEQGNHYIFIEETTDSKQTVFIKTPIKKGITDGQFTQIIPINAMNTTAKIALNNAFFILGKMINNGEE